MKAIIEAESGDRLCETDLDFIPPVGMVLMYDSGDHERTVKELYYDLDERILYVFTD